VRRVRSVAVDQPELYKRYTRSEAIAFFGAEREAQVLCDGQWIIWPDVALCLTDIGEPPRMSHFDRGSSFNWVADKPYKVSNERHTSFVPAEVVAGSEPRRAIKLFVRPGGSQSFLYVGTLGPSHWQKAPWKDSCGEAQFDLTPTLPSQIWEEIGGFKTGDTDHAAVDAALDRLRDQTTTQDRREVLQRLVEYWHGAIGPNEGYLEDELRDFQMPTTLRWWYRWAGRRPEIMSGQNFLLTPTKEGQHRQRMVDDRLLFYVENQWVYQWVTMPEGDDPPVLGRCKGDDRWESQRMTVSDHLILACLFEAIMCHSKYGASAAWLDERKLKKISATMAPVAISPWRWPDDSRPPGHTRFFARNGAFMFAMGHGTLNGRPGYSVWLGAKTEQPLQLLQTFLDKDWEYMS